MRIKTRELEGAALDWAVAKTVCPACFGEDWMRGWLSRGSPSTDWSQGGPLINERKVRVDPTPSLTSGLKGWQAECWDTYGIGRGPTALIAACRAIVAAELGDSVDVPDELLEKANGSR